MADVPAATAAIIPVKIPAAKATPQLMPVDMQSGEHKRVVYAVDVDLGIAPERLLDTDYWAHVAQRLAPWTKIEARAKDGTWYAEFIVLEAGRTWARVFPTMIHMLTTGDVAQSQAEHEDAITKAMALFKVVHRGPRGHSIVRVSDSKVIQEEIGSKDSALVALRTYVTENLTALSTE